MTEQPSGPGLGARFGRAFQNNPGLLLALGTSLLGHRQNRNNPMVDPALLHSGMQSDKATREKKQHENATLNYAVNELGMSLEEAMELMDAGLLADAVAAAWKSKNSPDHPASYDEYLLAKDDPGYAEHLESSGEAGGGYFGTPIYAKGPDGQTVLGQLGKQGDFHVPELPEGINLTPGVDKVDLGTHWGILNRAGDVVSTIPKDIEGAAAAEVRGKLGGEAQMDLGGALAKAQQSIDLIEQVIQHPGRGTGTGLSSKLDPRNYIAGTDATDFHVMNKQLQGKAFLEAFESLKGGGHITEVEGQKATEAIARLDTAQSDAAYVSALRELQSILRAGMDRARQRAGQATGAPQGGRPVVLDGKTYYLGPDGEVYE